MAPVLCRILAFLLYFPAISITHPLSVGYSHYDLAASCLEAIYRLPMDDMDLLLLLEQDLDGRVSSAELERSSDLLSG